MTERRQDEDAYWRGDPNARTPIHVSKLRLNSLIGTVNVQDAEWAASSIAGTLIRATEDFELATAGDRIRIGEALRARDEQQQAEAELRAETNIPQHQVW